MCIFVKVERVAGQEDEENMIRSHSQIYDMGSGWESLFVRNMLLLSK